MSQRQNRLKIASILSNPQVDAPTTIMGWVRTRRESKAGLAFVEVNDGSSFDNLQMVIPTSWPGYAEVVPRLHAGVSVRVQGVLVASQGGRQAVELRVEGHVGADVQASGGGAPGASGVAVLGECDPLAYPIGKQKISYETLREYTHLRPRTNTFGAIARLRDVLAAEVHTFFRARGFRWAHTPLITGNDAEGAGKAFAVTTLDLDGLGKSGKAPDFSKDFFGKAVSLTVSGQLEAESYALSLGDVYTFGPTFRAENSHTSRHLAEFWMVEPEMAFADLEDDMELAESFLKHLCAAALAQCPREMEFFRERVDAGIIERLQGVIERPFVRLTYTEAVARLQAGIAQGQKFEYPVEWGTDLQSEHERWLTEVEFKSPVILTDYPKGIKAFYMKVNDDGQTVRAMDVLVPHIGEIIGGSQREERIDVLLTRMREMGLDEHAITSLDWYLDLRRFGGAPHAGFGLGFERLVQFVSGMANIRDVIPFPRTPGKI
jgi:asparaginyl-tRNA synthetase